MFYVCAAPLNRLFPGSLPMGARNTMPRPDFWVFVGSLPGRLGVTLETLPEPISIDIALSTGGGTGVVTAGNSLLGRDSQRSLRGEDAARLRSLGRDLSPEATGAVDFLETAEIVARLDRIITVDTAMAHLAGSMGKPTSVLIQAEQADWRWLRDRTDSPWYPSVRLYRQAKMGDWRPVLEEVAGGDERHAR